MSLGRRGLGWARPPPAWRQSPPPPDCRTARKTAYRKSLPPRTWRSWPWTQQDTSDLRRLDDPDVRQVAIPLAVVQPVANDEPILDREPEVVDRDRHARARGFVQERTHLDARGRARVQKVHQVRDGQARVDDVLHEEHVLVLDGSGEILRDLDDPA